MFVYRTSNSSLINQLVFTQGMWAFCKQKLSTFGSLKTSRNESGPEGSLGRPPPIRHPGYRDRHVQQRRSAQRERLVNQEDEVPDYFAPGNSHHVRCEQQRDDDLLRRHLLYDDRVQQRGAAGRPGLHSQSSGLEAMLQRFQEREPAQRERKPVFHILSTVFQLDRERTSLHRLGRVVRLPELRSEPVWFTDE